VNHKVTRTIGTTTETIVQLSDLPGSSDQDLLLAAIAKVGTTRFRYTLASTPTWKVGQVTVSFADQALKNADSTDASGNVTQGTKSTAFTKTFISDGASARLVDPGLGGSIDVNVINDRNWIDVTFTPPTGWVINTASIVDNAPEFALSGPGLGSIVLDATRAPSKIATDIATNAVTYRYWLTGRFADTGDVTLTFLPNSWSVCRPGRRRPARRSAQRSSTSSSRSSTARAGRSSTARSAAARSRSTSCCAPTRSPWSPRPPPAGTSRSPAARARRRRSTRTPGASSSRSRATRQR
jgi:hypothetical protein